MAKTTFFASQGQMFTHSSASVRLTTGINSSSYQQVFGLAKRVGASQFKIKYSSPYNNYIQMLGPCNYNSLNVYGGIDYGISPYGDPTYTMATCVASWNDGAGASYTSTADPLYGDINCVQSDGTVYNSSWYSIGFGEGNLNITTPAPTSYAGLTNPPNPIGYASAGTPTGGPIYDSQLGAYSVTDTSITYTVADNFYIAHVGMAQIPVTGCYIGYSVTLTLSKPYAYDYYVNVSKNLLNSVTLLDEYTNPAKSYYSGLYGGTNYFLRFQETYGYGYDTSSYSNIGINGLAIYYDRSGSQFQTGSVLPTGSLNSGSISDGSSSINGYLGIGNVFYGLCAVGSPDHQTLVGSWSDWSGVNAWTPNPSGSWNGGAVVVSMKSAVKSANGLSSSVLCTYNPSNGSWSTSILGGYPYPGNYIFDPTGTTPSVGEFEVMSAPGTFNSYVYCAY